jgi:hypothetical protein
MIENPQLPAVIQSSPPMVMVTAETISFLPVISPAELMARRQELLTVVQNVLRKGEHYGVIPGSEKKNLLKPGAEILNQYFGFYAEFEVVSRVERWELAPPLFDYEYRCVVRSKRDHSKVAEGVGSCNSYEGKYRYRNATRSCPNCQGQSIIKGREEYGGGWVCWNKEKTACGAKFGEKDPAIVNQQVGKVDNEDIATLKNTILKMAAKRAYVDATLKATGASELFTQDLEDLKDQGVEIIDAEVVNEALKAQNEERKEEKSSKKEGTRKTVATGTAGSAATATEQTATAQQPVNTAESKEDPKSSKKPASTNGQSAASEAKKEVVSDSASDASKESRPGAEQMTQLLRAGTENGWPRADISNFVCETFNLTPKTILEKLTWKQWEWAVRVIGRPENKGGKVTHSGEGKPLQPENHWPKK